MKYDSIIIGSGLGGLVSSVLLAKAGKKVLMLEQHSIPGGYCTSFRRKGFTFSVPSVMNNIKEGEMYSILNSLGFFEEVKIKEIENFAKYIYPDFEIALPANDINGCRESFRHAFPTDKSAIDLLFSRMISLQQKIASLESAN